jgi:hypothetical protein
VSAFDELQVQADDRTGVGLQMSGGRRSPEAQDGEDRHRYDCLSPHPTLPRCDPSRKRTTPSRYSVFGLRRVRGITGRSDWIVEKNPDVKEI